METGDYLAHPGGDAGNRNAVSYTHLDVYKRQVIAIEDNKPEAAAQLQAACEAVSDQPLSVEVVVIPSRYPAGSASQLIQLLTGLEVPCLLYTSRCV